MSRGKRRSRCTDQEFIGAVRSSRSAAEALRRLNLVPNGANYKFVHQWCTRLSLDTSHWGSKSLRPSDEQIARAVAESSSARQVLHRFGLQYTGGNYCFLLKAVARLALDTSHWLGQAHLRGKTHNWAERIPLSEILVENSTYGATSRLKRRLLQEGLLRPGCQVCGSSDWRGKPLALVLDHSNGIHDDHRLENLRLL